MTTTPVRSARPRLAAAATALASAFLMVACSSGGALVANDGSGGGADDSADASQSAAAKIVDPTPQSASAKPSTPSSSKKAEPTAEPTPEAPKETVCASGVKVPDGVDPMVCNGIPAGAIELGSDSFMTPSQNIGCNVGYREDWVLRCHVMEYNFTPEIDHEYYESPCAGASVDRDGNIGRECLHEAPRWYYAIENPEARVETLNYGNTYRFFEEYACRSEESGLTCWEPDTGHGMFLSRDKLVSW